MFTDQCNDREGWGSDQNFCELSHVPGQSELRGVGRGCQKLVDDRELANGCK